MSEQHIPIHHLVLPDTPDVWLPPTDEQLVAAVERDGNGLLTERAMFARRQIEDGRWYLVKNVYGWGSRTGRVEAYFTTAGVERPYCGIWGVWAAFTEMAGDSETGKTLTLNAERMGALEPISVAQAQRLYDRIRRKVGAGGDIGPRPGSENRSLGMEVRTR